MKEITRIANKLIIIITLKMIICTNNYNSKAIIFQNTNEMWKSLPLNLIHNTNGTDNNKDKTLNFFYRQIKTKLKIYRI